MYFDAHMFYYFRAVEATFKVRPLIYGIFCKDIDTSNGTKTASKTLYTFAGQVSTMYILSPHL